MGRRPNQFVLEFFHRGKKLGDASNRYEHSCKSCGEHFSKGRVESMMTHLLKRCPRISQTEREAVFVQMQQASKKASSSANFYRLDDTANGWGQQTVDQGHQQMSQFSQASDQKALEALAEVSRRHLDYASCNVSNEFEVERPADVMIHEVEQTLIARLRQAVDPTPENAVVSERMNLSEASSSGRDHGDSSHDQEDHVERPPAGTLDPLLGTNEGETITRDTIYLDTHSPAVQNPAPVTDKPHPNEAATSSKALVPGIGMFGKSSKPRTRGRFTDTRRKQVQQIRKQGACLRCRMLKKPCSEGTPCSTCANVESARLWKGTCLRTRLADEFTLLSMGMFGRRAVVECAVVFGGEGRVVSSGTLTTRLFQDLDAELTLPAKLVIPSRSEGDLLGAIWLLDQEDVVQSGIEDFITQALPHFIAREKSVFLRRTLQRLRDLTAEEEQSPSVTSTTEPQIRSCYNLQSQLVRNMLELWVETSILTTSENLKVHAEYTPDADAQGQSDDGQQNPIPHPTKISPSLPGCDLMKPQILAAIESRAAQLARTAINELERRLLQRRQTSRFTTFLSAVLLLNCVERLLTSFHQAQAASHPFVPHHEPPPPTSSPHTNDPRDVHKQTAHFAHLLTSLLQTRGLPPRVLQSAEGKLVVDSDRQRGKEGMDEGDGMVGLFREWLDPMELSCAEWVGLRDGVDEGLEEGRWVSRALLPGG